MTAESPNPAYFLRFLYHRYRSLICLDCPVDENACNRSATVSGCTFLNDRQVPLARYFRPRFHVRNPAPSSRSANGLTHVFGGAFGSITNMIVEP